ncbi:hypothetical protein [Mycobacterium ostraviense]|nr:hypothetical protein [Mycobacterium ostraviense]UGT92063.1 hypothetical protein LTS72_00980 [Mycobacterium ostraviense]
MADYATLLRDHVTLTCHSVDRIFLQAPFTPEDLRAGYVYELAVRQFEISDTRVFDRPAAGRSFFEQLIRDHLDIR